MDTTYWGHNFGVMLFKDNITKENLLKYYVHGKKLQQFFNLEKSLLNNMLEM